MANNKTEDLINGNGWTRYQQLVLNELQRHENKLDSVQKDAVTTQISITKLETELKNISEHLKTLIIETTALESSLNSKITILNKEREELSSDMKMVKWKIGAWATGLSTVLTVGAQLVIKFLLQ